MTVADREQFVQANQLYRAEKYDKAQALYAALSERYPSETVFHFDLGNASFRLGKKGAAILAYEKAICLSPRHRDARNNLKYVLSQLEYRMEDKRSWYVSTGEAWLGWVSESEVNVLALLACFLFLGSWAFAVWRKPDAIGGWGQKTALILFLAALGIFLVKRVEARMIRAAIVMAPKAEVRFGPSDGDRVAFRLGEGLKVYVVDHREGWSRVLLVNGEEGWMKDAQIAEVLRGRS